MNSGSLEPTWQWPQAAYVHVPFCAHKCGYCDFASVAGAEPLADRYLDALEQEFTLRIGSRQPVRTIFVGGGTPTRLDVFQLERLTRTIQQFLALEPGGEWTVEANPGTLDADKADVLVEAGVNRISLGAQSFRVESLRTLERNHDPDDVPRALDIVRARFASWSLDLIFGVPGSTLADWISDLETAIAFQPSHLSCYGLTYEKGTALWKQRSSGQVLAIEEEVERAMYAHTLDRLAQVGLEQYEISNFARRGQESRHNLVYWVNDAYFGLGLGATRYVRRERASNTRDLMGYLRRLETGLDPTGPREILEPEATARETAVLMLRRTVSGLDRGEFTRRTGYDVDPLFGPVLNKYIRLALLQDDGDRIRFTRDGLFVADSVLCELL